ncbi:MAG: cytochrome c family protein [Ahrensia sp.]|nr:cytochrome c family protein [Ahrensia sp.]
MDSMKTTMYAGAFLATGVMLMTLNIIGGALFHSETPEQFGYEIAAAEGSAPASEEAAPAELAAITPLLASADVASGETIFKKCASCHNVADGAANKVGPNLWNVIGHVPGAMEGFKYSSAMVSFGAEHGPWDFESLNGFLLKPKEYIKGTAMGFAGLEKEKDRADLIAYLNSQSASPVAY